MNYEVAIINPKTGEERQILAELSQQQADDAKSALCLQSFVQAIAKPAIPDGFLPLGNGVRPVTQVDAARSRNTDFDKSS